MLLNEHTAIHTSRVILVPYGARHVAAYHQWMQDEELRGLTASDPLTLDEEYEMQRSWRRDGDKLTFILCLPSSPSGSSAPSESSGAVKVETEVEAEAESEGGMGEGQMVGDVNLFLSTTDTDESGEAVLVGELELMIAEKSQQGKGLGKAGLLAFLKYISLHTEDILREYHARSGMRLGYFRVRISEQNARSISLFEGLGFTKAGDGKANYFGEVELRLSLSGLDADGLLRHARVGEWREVKYHHM